MRLKLNFSSVIILLCGVFWCTPRGIDLLLSQYSFVLNSIRCILWSVLLFLVVCSNNKLSTFCKILHLFWIVFLCCILSSDYTTTNLNTWLIPFCSICGLCLLFELYKNEKIITILFWYFYIISIINIILIFVMPDGFNYQMTSFDGLSVYDMHSTFISSDNMYAPYMMCFLLLGEIYCVCYNSNKQFIYASMWLIVAFTSIKVFSATCLIGLAFYVISVVLYKWHKNLSRINIKSMVMLFFSIFILIYWAKAQSLFSFIIINLLGKDITLTGRIGLWDSSLEMIGEKLLLGWGNLNKGAIILRDYFYWYSHNLVLDILLEGGIVTLAAFSFLIYIVYREIYRLSNNIIIKSCLHVMFGFVILNIAESYFSSIYFYMPLIIAVTTAKVESKKSKLIV